MAKGAVCKTVSCGFNSHPRLHFFVLPENHIRRRLACRFELEGRSLAEIFEEKTENELDKPGKRDYITGYSIEKENMKCARVAEWQTR